MALKPFNSVGGFAVGETPNTVILSNGDITTTRIDAGSSNDLVLLANAQTVTLYGANGLAAFPGNVSASYFLGNFSGNISGNIVAAGENKSILYNQSGNVAGDTRLTWDYEAGNYLFRVDGNANIESTILSNTGSIYANAGNVQANNLIATKLVKGETLESTVTTGTAPFTVISTTVVTNLNADLLDGYNSSITAVANTVVVRNVDGNVAGNYFIGNGSQLTGIATAGNLANGTSNVTIPTADGNVNISVAGNANIAVITGTGVNVNGTLNATGNANVGNLGATAGVFTANITTTGNIYANSGTVGASLLTGTLTTAAQPNITSVGNLTSLTVTGNANVGNLTTAGKVVGSTLESTVSTGTAPFTVASTTKVTNLNADLLDGYDTATANTASTVAVRDASGNISANFFIGNGSQLTGIDTTLISNGTANVRAFQDANVTISAAGTANVVVVTGTGANIAGTANVTGNANVGGTLGVTGNANVGNLGTATAIITTGNITTINSGLMQNSTSNVAITSAGNVTLTVAGTARITATSTGANVNGTLGVSGNANVGNLGTAGLIVAQGNVTGGNIVASGGVLNVTGTGQSNIAGTLSVTGNANVGNIGAASGVLTGTLSVTGNSNVGNLGTAGLIVATGNITGGNLVTGGQTVATGNITGGNFVTAGVLNASGVGVSNVGGNLVAGGSLTVNGTGVSTIAGNLDMSGKNIGNLAAPVNSSDAATKEYVDAVAEGLHVHAPAGAATDDTLANISSGTVTYNNGSSGIGATLVTTGTYTTIDGVTLTSGIRILVKNEANAAHNGIYVFTNSTTLTRADDFNTPTEMAGGDFTFVTAGTLYNSTGWVMVDAVTTVGTDPVNWSQFSGAGTYTAGTGLTLTGTEFSITNTAVSAASYGNGDRVASFTVNPQGQLTAASNVVIAANAANLTGTTLNSSIVNSSLTSVGTLGSLNVTGNIEAGNVYANLGTIGASSLTGTLTTAAQPNITSVGNLTSLNVTGNITAPNITANTGVFTGNGSGLSALNASNISTGTLAQARLANASVTLGSTALTLGDTVTTVIGLSSVTSTTFVGALTGAATTAGTVTTAAQPNITSVGTLSSVTVTGNATAGNLVTTSGVVAVGNSTVRSVTTTTSSTSPNQVVSTFSTTGINGVEYFIKGVDGSKVYVATVVAATNGSLVDYVVYGTANLNAVTGTIVVALNGSNIELQVTPASSNSTTWTAQIKVI